MSVRRVIYIECPFFLCSHSLQCLSPSCTLRHSPFPDVHSCSPLVRRLAFIRFEDDSHALINHMLHIVCAIALRYSEKPEVYPIAMHFAKSAASSALVDGWKSVELCQAYILMSIYAVPARRWEEDRSWLYTGLAIRCANFSQREV
jgi:hypothetical protein